MGKVVMMDSWEKWITSVSIAGKGHQAMVERGETRLGCGGRIFVTVHSPPYEGEVEGLEVMRGVRSEEWGVVSQRPDSRTPPPFVRGGEVDAGERLRIF